jgi:hypothetical protein
MSKAKRRGHPWEQVPARIPRPVGRGGKEASNKISGYAHARHRRTAPGQIPYTNRADNNPEYMVRRIGQVVVVSLETVKLVTELAALSIDQV